MLKRIDNLHPHASLVHLSITFTVVAPFVFLGWIISRQPVFDHVTFAVLGLCMISVALSFATGIISWILRYETKAARVFNLKFALGVLLFLMVTGTFFWRLTGQLVIIGKPGYYYYLAFLFIQLIVALLMDYYGKKVVYS